MKVKRILFFIDSLSCGGAEKSLVSLLQTLNKEKVDVTLMLQRRGGAFEKYVPDWVKIIDFSPIKSGSYWNRISYSASKLLYSFMLRIKRCRHTAETRWLCQRNYIIPLDEKYDVAIAYQQGFPTYYVSEKVNANKKYCWVNADLLNVHYRPSFNKKFYSSYDGICAVSDNLREKIIKDGFVDRNKVYVVYDIINTSLISSMADDFSVRRNADVNILTVGRLVEPKGYDLAIKAAGILRDKSIKFKWTFVGEGPCRPQIEKMIRNYNLENHIELAGLQTNPYPFMKACDIYVQTSRYEGFGITITEAKILNKPIVSTNFDVVYNQLQDGVNGLIAEMTAESIAHKIIALIENQPLKESLINATKQEVNTTSITEPQKVMELIMS